MSSELSSLLMPNIIISNTPAANYVIHKLWQINPNMLVKGMFDIYAKDPSYLARILDVAAQELKVCLTHLFLPSF